MSTGFEYVKIDNHVIRKSDVQSVSLVERQQFPAGPQGRNICYSVNVVTSGGKLHFATDQNQNLASAQDMFEKILTKLEIYV